MKKLFTILSAALFSATMFATTYTVAGSSDVLFGTTWDPTNTANDMSLVAETTDQYELVKSDMTLAAGTIQFKVCEDHAWTTAYPAQDFSYTISESGVYDVTFTFNATSHEVNCTASLKQQVVVLPSIAMHGNFTGTWANTNEFTVSDDETSASLTLTLTANVFEFGMRIGGAGNWTSNGAAFTRENNAHEITSGSGNLTLSADVAGDYLFTWTFESNTLEITYPDNSGVVVTPNYYLIGNDASMAAWDIDNAILMENGTIDLNLTEGDYQFKIVLQKSWTGLQLTCQNLAPEAPAALTCDENQNVCFTLTEAATITISVVDGAIMVAGLPEEVEEPVIYTIVGEEALVGVNWDPAATANDMTKLEDNSYQLIKTNVTLEAGDYEYKVIAGHAWNGWELPVSVNQTLTIEEENTYIVTFALTADLSTLTAEAVAQNPSAIDNTESHNAMQKVLMNGHLYILVDGALYNVQGVIVK